MDRHAQVGLRAAGVAGVAAALLMFFLQKDLGPALFLSCVFLALYAVARGRWPMALVGVATLVASFYLAYQWELSRTLAGRVAMWRSPWNNAAAGGDQVSQSLWALATGGVFGTGLGLGETRFIPAGHTDLILAAAGEELGLGGLLAIAAVFATMAWRGFRAARDAKDDHGFFLATALTLFLVVPVLVMAAGILGAMPLTGVVTPFLSYGGSAMAANFTALGLLAGLRRSAARRRPRPARRSRSAGRWPCSAARWASPPWRWCSRWPRCRWCERTTSPCGRIWDGRRTASAATNTTRASSPCCARCRAARSTTAPA